MERFGALYLRPDSVKGRCSGEPEFHCRAAFGNACISRAETMVLAKNGLGARRNASHAVLVPVRLALESRSRMHIIDRIFKKAVNGRAGFPFGQAAR